MFYKNLLKITCEIWNSYMKGQIKDEKKITFECESLFNSNYPQQMGYTWAKSSFIPQSLFNQCCINVLKKSDTNWKALC